MAARDADIVRRAEARVGTVLRGKYRLDAVLGVGGMAVVYRATHRNQARFAVKMLHAEVSINADIRARFLREGYAANSLNHHGAVLVVDDDVSDDGVAFLVMELLEGVSSEDVAHRFGNQLPYDVATAILIQLLDVLTAAHARGVVHRDIKPANLFLTRNGIVKVLDFGIARAREALLGTSGATGTGITLGTPAFMAHEQALGRSREVDGRTDVWAAGATFFWLVTGEYVHVGETVQELMVKAATAHARPLAAVADLPVGLASVIDRSLAFSREHRWQTAAQMRAALMALRPPGSMTPEAVVAGIVSGEISFPSLRSLPTIDARPIEDLSITRVASVDATSGTERKTSSVAPTTAATVAPSTFPTRGKSPTWMVPAAAALAAAVSIGTFALRSRESSTSHDEAFSTVGADSGASVTAAMSPASNTTPQAEPSPAMEHIVELPMTPVPVPTHVPTAAAPVATAAPDVAQRPAVSRNMAVQPSTVASASAPAAVAPSAAPNNCEPSYTVDADGHKSFKPECFPY